MRAVGETNRVAQQTRATDFWSEVRRLEPTAIALGADDFMRGLRANNPSAPSAATLVDRLASLELPFLASNAFIRFEPKDDAAGPM